VAGHKNGEGLSLLFSLCDAPSPSSSFSSSSSSSSPSSSSLLDGAARFGLLHVALNLATSSHDLLRDYDKEVEELRKIAQRGLPQSMEKKEDVAARAGSPAAIKVIKKLMLKAGAVSMLGKLFRAYQQQAQRPLSDQPQSSPVLSENVCMAFASCLLHLASETELRGAMVQQGALKLLLQLYRHPSGKCQETCALSLARLCISLDPSLFPASDDVVPQLLTPLLTLIKKAEHELYLFEGCLALTNLASLGEGVCERLVELGAWSAVTALLTTDNTMLQRAAVEAMTNMVMCESSLERLKSEGGQTDLQMFLLFAQSEDEATRCAATGALAMISADPDIAVRIARTQLVSQETLEEADDEANEEVAEKKEGKGEGKDESASPASSPSPATKTKQHSRSGWLVLRALFEMPTLSPAVRARVNVAWKNIQQATANLSP